MLMRVQVSKQKPDFSKWTLRYHAFGRDFEFSWLARNMEVSPRLMPFFPLDIRVIGKI